ncbi:SH3 domain-containing protein [Porphyridium purpureum]|uniref:SH3 domain-containing protein n=1 Tax=Porphyridium purpureum TaxID=35688 RepID=A0A5J4YXQ6_PORPP|nr:SH3 domain-containing protein [Porphyridium purpureum]|eukprot:POR3524..scf209_3
MGIYAMQKEVRQAKGVLAHGVPLDSIGSYTILERPLKVPEEHYKECYGVAVFAEYSMALGVGALRGYGIVVKKLNKGSADETWSAPVPFSINGMQVGASVGIAKTEFIMFLTSPEQVKAFEHDAEIKLTASVVGSGQNNEMHMAQTTQTEGMAERIDLSIGGEGPIATGIVYAHARGVMLSAALGGSVLHLERQKLLTAYGNNATAAAVLNGEIGMDAAYSDEDMQVVYRLLNKKK